MVLIVDKALRRSGKDLTREKFLDVMDNLRDFDVKVLLGNVSFSKTHHLAGVDYVFITLNKNGIEHFTDKSEWDPGIMRKRGWE